MYRPAAFRVDDQPRLFDFIESNGFATLVTAHSGGMIASHVPVLLDRAASSLFLHLAKANEQVEHLAAGVEALCIFHGPHGYVSPSWYEASPAVPTWNYAAVHVYGRARVAGDEETMSALEAMVRQYESAREAPWRFDPSLEWNRKMRNGITGFHIPIERMEGKFKMSQNRSVKDREGVIAALGQSALAADRELAEFMKAI